MTAPKIAVVTDSNAQLPPDLAARYDIAVVPLPVIVDGRQYLEGVDLDVEDFYSWLGKLAVVSTSQPSPGAIGALYTELAAQGYDEIVSVHVGSELSGTCNSARLAAESIEIPVHVVDTGQASFSVGCAALAAAEAREAGGQAADVVTAAQWTSEASRNVFVMDGIGLAEASGRVEISDELRELDERPEIPVMTFDDGDLVVLGTAGDISEATDLMASAVLAGEPGPLRCGVGVAGREAWGFYDAFEHRVADVSTIEVLRYRCGPTVGAFTGIGTVGAVWCPR